MLNTNDFQNDFFEYDLHFKHKYLKTKTLKLPAIK